MTPAVRRQTPSLETPKGWICLVHAEGFEAARPEVAAEDRPPLQHGALGLRERAEPRQQQVLQRRGERRLLQARGDKAPRLVALVNDPAIDEPVHHLLGIVGDALGPLHEQPDHLVRHARNLLQQLSDQFAGGLV